MWDGAAVGHGEEPELDRKEGQACVCPGELADLIPKPRAWAVEGCGISIWEEEEEALVRFWFEIPSFPSLEISRLLFQDNPLALLCCRNPEAPELPRGTWLILCLICSTKACHITCTGTKLRVSSP